MDNFTVLGITLGASGFGSTNELPAEYQQVKLKKQIRQLLLQLKKSQQEFTDNIYLRQLDANRGAEVLTALAELGHSYQYNFTHAKTKTELLEVKNSAQNTRILLDKLNDTDNSEHATYQKVHAIINYQHTSQATPGIQHANFLKALTVVAISALLFSAVAAATIATMIATGGTALLIPAIVVGIVFGGVTGGIGYMAAANKVPAFMMKDYLFFSKGRFSDPMKNISDKLLPENNSIKLKS